MMFKKLLCASLAGCTLLLASCTRILLPDESEEEFSGGIIYYSEEVSDQSKTDTSKDELSSSAEIPSEEESSDVSIEIPDDPKLKIPTTVTASNADAFFDGSIFVGNSIMLKYRNFVNKYRASSVPDFLGTSEFFCGGSFGVYHNNHTPADQEGAVNPTYKGVKYSVQDMIGVANPKRVFLNLAGLNDMGIYSSADTCASETAKEMINLMEDIRTRYPGVEIVVLSTTYMIKSWNSMPKLNNENLSIMNNLVLDYCNSNGIDFVDISTLLNGDNGCLDDKYCSDPDSGGCHLNDSGCLVWTGLLRYYAEQKLAGTYKNPESMPALSKG